MRIRIFDLGEELQPAESLSPSVLLNLAFDPVARSASQSGSGISEATRHGPRNVAVLRPRELAQKSLLLFV